MRKRFSLLMAIVMFFSILSSSCVVYSEEVVLVSDVAGLVSAVTNGGIYKVADGVTEIDCSAQNLQIRNSMELDLNNATIKVNTDGFNFQSYEMAVTLKNGTISGTGNYTIKAMAKTPSVINLENITTTGSKNGIASANSYYTVNITGGNIGGTTSGIAATMGYYTVNGALTGGIIIKNESTLELNNVNVSAVGRGIDGYNTTSAVISGGTINSGTNNHGIHWASSGNLSITDTNIFADANGKGIIHLNNSTANVTLTNATVNNTCTTATKAYSFSNNSGDASNIIVNSGTYTGLFSINSASTAKLTIKGGSFNTDPTKYLAEGYAVSEQNGIYTVISEADITPSPIPSPTTEPEETPEPTATPVATVTPTPEPTEAPKLTVDSVYSSNMIFQRNKPITISGTAVSGNTVEVKFNGNTAKTIAKYGVWEITLPASDVVKSADMTISSSSDEQIELSNIAVGDVILFSGQSNMFRDFNSFKNLKDEVDKDYPDIRLYSANAADSGWQVATTVNATNFSTTGFMTGKRLYNNTNGEVPIGLIRAAYDGSNITSWVSNTAYTNDPDLYQTYSNSNQKSKWHTAYIKPLQKLEIGGVMWYQGEGNTWYKNNNYEKAMTMLIESWRDEWNNENLPFAIVQLPTADFGTIYGNRTNVGGFSSGLEVRDAQWKVSQKMENVTTVVSIDTGRKTEVHPQDKQPIADRAAKVFEHYLMGKNVVYQSPSYDRMETSNGKTTIYFKNVADKLISKDDTEIKGFEVAGADGAFTSVAAEISEDGQTIVIDTTGIENPQIRYAWSDIPSLDESNTQYYSNINLVNESGFAVAPFRTDSGKYMYYIASDESEVMCNFTPWIREITPVNGSAVGENVTFTVKADDVDGSVTAVEIFVDDVSAGAAVKTGDVWTLTVNGLTAGNHTVYAVATDNDGAVSTTQDGSMGTTTQITYPRRNTFLVGDGAAEVNVTMPSSDTLADYVTTKGTTSQVTIGGPSGYYANDMVKFSAAAASDAAAVTIPVNVGSEYNILDFEANVYFENSGAYNDSSMTLEAITGNNETRTLFFFTATSLRIGGNYYEILKNAKENNKWYRLRIKVDLYNGSFSAWVNGELQYNNQTWIYQGKDFDKQYTWFQSLKTGISKLKLTHTQGTADVTTATYVDGMNLNLSTFNTTMPTAEISYTNGKVSAVFENINTTGMVFVAEHNSKGELAGVKVAPLSENVNIDYTPVTDKIKVYVWDSNLVPLFNVFPININ